MPAPRSGSPDAAATLRPLFSSRPRRFDTTLSPEPFDLMEYSALDTNSGVFYGEYDEKVNDEITVKVGLEVTMLDGKITGIELKDTAWVHPLAALRSPAADYR